MPAHRKNQLFLTCLFSLSLLSFLYLNFYGISTAETISSSDISTFEAVESTSFPEVRAVRAVWCVLIDIVTLK